MKITQQRHLGRELEAPVESASFRNIGMLDKRSGFSQLVRELSLACMCAVYVCTMHISACACACVCFTQFLVCTMFTVYISSSSEAYGSFSGKHCQLVMFDFGSSANRAPILYNPSNDWIVHQRDSWLRKGPCIKPVSSEIKRITNCNVSMCLGPDLC